MTLHIERVRMVEYVVMVSLFGSSCTNGNGYIVLICIFNLSVLFTCLLFIDVIYKCLCEAFIDIVNGCA